MIKSVELLTMAASMLHPGISIVEGDFPYAAWNNYDVEPDKPAKWWQRPCEFAVIMIPESYSQNEQLFSGMHELGHVMNWLFGNKFTSQFDEEVHAWKLAYASISNSYHPKIPAFKIHCLKCLATYNKANVFDLEATWNTISS